MCSIISYIKQFLMYRFKKACQCRILASACSCKPYSFIQQFSYCRIISLMDLWCTDSAKRSIYISCD